MSVEDERRWRLLHGARDIAAWMRGSRDGDTLQNYIPRLEGSLGGIARGRDRIIDYWQQKSA